MSSGMGASSISFRLAYSFFGLPCPTGFVPVGRGCILDGVDAAQPEGWEEIEGALQRTFRFKDFVAAIDFVNRVAEVAEAENHHPDIEIHWNHVKLRFWTHSQQAITERDHALAARTNSLA
jgi:4a-hydroxytetrahydrobiopterin dehydratase